MIGKIIKPGKSFKGCVLYNVEKPQAVILEAFGVRTDRSENIIRDFNMQRKMNPELGQAVGHISLSWSPHDRDKLTPEIMAERAKEYMENMKITDTQYLLVEHRDRPHPHVHIVYNRVDNQGRTIPDRFQKRHNARVCKDMTLKHGYYIAQGKAQVNRQRLTGADKIRYELHDAISQAVKTAGSWQELEARLQHKGIGMQYKFKGGTTEVQGISFSKGVVKFKGSEIDRSMSYGRLNGLINQNSQQTVKQGPHFRIAAPGPSYRPPAPQQQAVNKDGLLDILLAPVYLPEQPNPFLKKKKRRLKL